MEHEVKKRRWKFVYEDKKSEKTSIRSFLQEVKSANVEEVRSKTEWMNCK